MVQSKLIEVLILDIIIYTIMSSCTFTKPYFCNKVFVLVIFCVYECMYLYKRVLICHPGLYNVTWMTTHHISIKIL